MTKAVVSTAGASVLYPANGYSAWSRIIEVTSSKPDQTKLWRVPSDAITTMNITTHMDGNCVKFI
jgi:hypothetical protein